MKRALLMLGALAALGAVVLAPAPPPPPPGEQYLPVSRTVLACPELSVTSGSAAILTGMVASDVAGSPQDPTVSQDPTASPATTASQGTATPAEALAPEGWAALRRIDGEMDLGRLTAPGVPVGLLAVHHSQPPTLLVASGAWAPGALAAVATRQLSGAAAGLASTACSPPGPTWWFVGSGSQIGRGAALLVSNPSQDPARFDISLYAPSGPLEPLAGKGIDLGPQSYVRLRLDALTENQDVLAVGVRTSSGRVAVSLRDVAVPEVGEPRGLDFVPPGVAPTTALWIGGIPGGTTSTTLVLVNPGSQFATVVPRLITSSGTNDLTDLGSLTVPAGSVLSVAMDGLLPADGGTLALTSDIPITGSVASTWGTDRQDVAWTAATPLIAVPNTSAGAVAVPAGGDLSVSVTVAAPTDQAAIGRLTIIASGTSEDAILADRKALANALGDVAAPSSDATRLTPAGPPTVVSVSVPAGRQRTIDVASAASAAQLQLTWRSDPGSGAAIVSHLVLDPKVPLATGWSWWPNLAAVAGVGVREDLGVLAPTD